MLEFHALKESPVAPERLVQLLLEFKENLLEHGMASMTEYGDMLNWGLPKGDGWGRSFHVFDPGFCSFDDVHYGTVHYHGGTIRGTLLLGSVTHDTYDPTEDPEGDRVLGDTTYRLVKHTRRQDAGTTYTLPAMVAHWMKPRELTLTYFEEEDNERMGDLVNLRDAEADDHAWTQADADALVPRLLAMVDARVAELTVHI